MPQGNPDNNASVLLSRYLTYDNLFKFIGVMLFSLGTWLWSDINGQLTKLENTNATLNDTITNMRVELGNKANKNDLPPGVDISPLVREIDELRAEANRDHDSHDAAISRLEDRMSHHSHGPTREVLALNQSVGALTSSVNTLTSKLNQLDLREVPDIREDISQVEQDVQRVEQEVASIRQMSPNPIGNNISATGSPTRGVPRSDGSFPTAPSIPGVSG